jgi:multicomponent Na+:H+ antiporter subunit E
VIIRLSGIIVWLTVLWLLLWDDLSVANVLSGIAIAAVVVTSARLPRVVRRGDAGAARVKPLATLWFGLYVLYKLVESNLYLAWEIVTPRNRINSGVIAVPLRTDSSMAMMVVANVITLTPGTMTLEVQGSPPVLYVNVLHLHDVEEIRADLLRLEELAVRAFGSQSARESLDARTTA